MAPRQSSRVPRASTTKAGKSASQRKAKDPSAAPKSKKAPTPKVDPAVFSIREAKATICDFIAQAYSLISATGNFPAMVEHLKACFEMPKLRPGVQYADQDEMIAALLKQLVRPRRFLARHVHPDHNLHNKDLAGVIGGMVLSADPDLAFNMSIVLVILTRDGLHLTNMLDLISSEAAKWIATAPAITTTPEPEVTNMEQEGDLEMQEAYLVAFEGQETQMVARSQRTRHFNRRVGAATLVLTTKGASKADIASAHQEIATTFALIAFDDSAVCKGRRLNITPVGDTSDADMDFGDEEPDFDEAETFEAEMGADFLVKTLETWQLQAIAWYWFCLPQDQEGDAPMRFSRCFLRCYYNNVVHTLNRLHPKSVLDCLRIDEVAIKGDRILNHKNSNRRVTSPFNQFKKFLGALDAGILADVIKMDATTTDADATVPKAAIHRTNGPLSDEKRKRRHEGMKDRASKKAKTCDDFDFEDLDDCMAGLEGFDDEPQQCAL
jgi:hypothetical protein